MTKIKTIFTKCILIFFITGSYHLSQAQDHDHMHASPVQSNVCNSQALECANAATPFITNDDQLWVTWTAGGAVSVAKSKDLGKTFESQFILSEHGKSLDTGGDARPQIIVDQNGRIVITYAFFKDNRWNAQINSTVSRDGGVTFSKPKSIVQDDTSQRFPVMLLQQENSIFMSWIDKRLIALANKNGNKKLGGAVAYGWLDQDGKIASKEFIANPDSCECCRIGVSLTKDHLPAIVYRGILTNGIRDHVMQVIQKNGLPGKIHVVANDAWKTDTCPHHGPSMTISQNDTVHVAWYTQGANRNGVFYAKSINQGITFSEPMRIGNESANVGRPYLLSRGTKVFLVWKEFDGKSSTVYLQISNDDGQHWSEKKIVSQTSGYSDHPILVKSQKRVYLSWLTRLDGYQLIDLE